MFVGPEGLASALTARVRQMIMAPIREHSRKPADVYDRIEMYCGGPRLDLFGRQSRNGWSVVGNEATKFDKRVCVHDLGASH